MTTLVIADMSTEDRERLKAMARAAGRLGASRVPDEALFPGGLDPSDTGLIEMIDALIEGREQRK